MSLSPLDFALAPLAVWFSLSTCLANWKLPNSATCQNKDAYCSPKKRERLCAGEMAQRLTLLAPFSTGPDLRPPHPCHMPSIPANSCKPNCGGMETQADQGLACFQPSGDVNPGLRKKPCSKGLCEQKGSILVVLFWICEEPGEPRVHAGGLTKEGTKAHGSVTPQEQTFPATLIYLSLCS